MADNIILPAVPVLSEIDDSTKLLIEQAGEINRYPISDLDIGGGDVTIDLSSSDSVDNSGNPINADTLGGKPASEYATHNFVTTKIAEAKLAGEDIDLSDYALKSDIPTAIHTAFTQAKESMVQEVIDAIGLKVIGEVDEANNILITVDLPDGTYMLRYENADGSTTDIGSLNIGSGPAYTNLADPTSADWLTNKRINSSGSLVDVTEAQRGDDTVVITNYIDMSGVSKLYIKGLDVMSTLSSGQNYGRFYQYSSAKVLQTSAAQPSKLPSGNIWVTKADYDDSVWVVDLVGLNGEWGYIDERYCRWGGILTGAAEDVIITADQKIV